MFTLSIDTSGEEFQPDPAPEVARLLRQVVHGVEAGDQDGTLRATDSRIVGSYRYEDDDLCPRHGGPWGDDLTCTTCTTADGRPKERA